MGTTIKGNKNETLKWLLNKNNIKVDEKIKDTNNVVRGVYGIFLSGECLYVGKSESIYDRMFGTTGHITNLMKGNHFNVELTNAMSSDKLISIEILEEVPLKLDSFCKDMQRLASAENRHIDFYHEADECLNQLPEGRGMKLETWERKKRE